MSEAHDLRYEAKKLLKSNIDPNSQKRQAKITATLDASNSFMMVAEDWHSNSKSKWTDEHAERLWRRLELHAFPQIGTRPISQIRTPELINLLRKLEQRKKPETAGRLAQTLNVVFRYAVHCGIIDRNPAAELTGIIVPHQTNHFAAIPPAELLQLLAKMDATMMTSQNRIAMKLLLHTFLRPRELRYGKWEELDLENALWVYSAGRE